MRDWLTWKAIAVFVPVVLGPLAYLLMGALKATAVFIDRQPAVIQRGAVVVIAWIIAAGAQAAGLQLECLTADGGCTIGDLDTSIVQAMLGGAVAMLMHALKKAPPA